MKKASESRKGNSSKDAVSQVRNGANQQESEGKTLNELSPAQRREKVMLMIHSFLSWAGPDGADENEMRLASEFKGEFDEVVSALLERKLIERTPAGRLRIVQGVASVSAASAADDAPRSRWAMGELDEVVDRAMALIELLAHELAAFREESSNDEGRANVAGGLVMLGTNAKLELRRAFDAAFDEYADLSRRAKAAGIEVAR